MKRWGWKKLSAISLALSLAVSATALAAGTEMELQETMTYGEQEAKETESLIYVTEKQQREGTFAEGETEAETRRFKKASQEDVKAWEKGEEKQETAVILFQPRNYWADPAGDAEQTGATEVLTAPETSAETVLDFMEDGTEETEFVKGLEEEASSTVVLTAEQKKQVEELASLTDNLFVVVNGGTLENEFLFEKLNHVKAVLSLQETTEEDFIKKLESLSLEEISREYQEKLKEYREGTKTAVAVKEEPLTDSLEPGRDLSRSGVQTPGTTGTEGGIGSDVNGTSGTSGTPGTSSTTKKQITLSMEPDPLIEEDEEIYVIYNITGVEDLLISEGSFKLTFDSTKMSYDSDYSDAGGDVMDYFTYTATEGAGSVTMNLKSNNGTPVAVKDAILDIGLELKTAAKLGDTYNLKLEVLSLKNGTQELTTDSNYQVTVKEETIRTIALDEEDEGEEEEEETQPQSQTQPQSETQPQSQTQTQTQTQALQKAAKTADPTDSTLWMLLLTVSAGLCVILQKKRQKL